MKYKLRNVKLDNGYVQTHLVECPYCGNKDIKDIKHILISEGTTSEYDYYCPTCKKEVGHWAYGKVDLEPEDIAEVLNNENK